MCGIAGWIDWERDLSGQQKIIREMTNTLALRGPDMEETWLSKRAALGHRRLIVVDPVGGGQPMIRKQGDTTFVLVYNGELYNTEELRAELVHKGCGFKGYSDTEVLLTAYMEWGPGCLEKLNGIFAFAVWNTSEQSLFLARDRLGVKPLFYTERGRTFLFASEPKALLAHPDIEAEIDEEGLNELFSLGPARSPGTGVFRGINEVRPGYYLTVNHRGCRTMRYWRLESHPHEDDLKTTADNVRELLRDAVRRQLVADVPVCVLLSGGLDSSAITAFAAEVFKEKELGPLHTWSVDYAGNKEHFKANAFQPDADSPWIRKVSDCFGTVRHQVELATHSLVQALTATVQARDLPGMADVDTSLYLFCREIKREATVALSGESADEIFGGYPWFHRPGMITAETFPWAVQRPRLLNPGIRDKIRPRDYITQRYQETLAEVARLPGQSPNETRMREISYLNIIWFLTTLLDRKDRMSMAHGLEVRVPFCDHRIVEYVWNIPWAMKTCDGMAKGILRRGLVGVLPAEVLARRKSPYPKTHNPEYMAAVRAGLKTVLDDPKSRILPLINIKEVLKLVTGENRQGDNPWFGQLMTGAQLFAYLIQIDCWLRLYNVRICL